MTELNQKILDMISMNASVNEISSVTGLSNKQLFYRLNMLRSKGYNFSRKYYYDGEITYKLQKGFEIEQDIVLLTRPEDTELKAVFISDLHLANKEDRVDLLNEIYEFCAREGIHIIINCGDIIDGCLGFKEEKKFKTLEEQIEYMLKVYPYDKNILNFTCFGNHDYSSLEFGGQNLETILSIKRHDIISLGYGLGKLKIKNDEIVVRHFNAPTNKSFETLNGLVLVGHTHRSEQRFYNYSTNIYVPSLSGMKKIQEDNSYPFPSFMKATINFKNGIFWNMILESYIFIDKIYKINEIHQNLGYGKDTKQSTIKNEVKRITYTEKQKVKTLNIDRRI